MRISSIAHLSCAALVVVLAALSFSVVWSLERLHRAYQATEAYYDYAANIQTKIAQPLREYLNSGNALRLNAADNELTALAETTPQQSHLSEETKAQALAIIEQLQSKTLPSLRAAGKLQDPQSLLINNERELLAEATTLIGQVTDSNAISADVRAQYLSLIASVIDDWRALAYTRQRIFNQSAIESTETADDFISLLQSSTQALLKLPPLEIYREDDTSDELDLGDMLGWGEDSEEKEDISVDTINNLVSLANRYPKELENAQAFIAAKKDVRSQTQSTLTELNATLLQLKHQLDASYREILNDVYILLAISITGLVLIGAIIVLLTHRLAHIIEHASHLLKQLSEGKINTAISLPHSQHINEAGVLSDAMLALKSYFTNLISQVSGQARSLQSVGSQVTSTSQDLSAVAESQQQSTRSSHQQLSHLNASFKAVSENAATTSEQASVVKGLVNHGASLIKQTTQNVGDLSNSVEYTQSTLNSLQSDASQIKQALGVIKEFSEQTNLLALNASIEAARAGEFGRGFAVVATEVRDLANNTADAASNINELTNQLNATMSAVVTSTQGYLDKINETVTLSHDAERSVEEIAEAIVSVDTMSTQIAAATQDQTALAEQLTQTMEANAKIADNSLDMARNNNSHAKELLHTSEQLNQLIRQFG
ncbi:MAG: methyl-accepting chemotaxis protein [Pontibacterium sp.]